MEPIWVPYCGTAPVPGEWLLRWNIDALLLVVLAGGAAWSWSRAESPAARSRIGLALGLLLVLFVSPLCALSSALFSVRVAHHLLLTAVAAPLLVSAWPRSEAPGGPAVWAVVHGTLFWLWHAPPAYGAALASDTVYWLMQASLFGSALAFWAALRAAPMPFAVGLLLAMMVQMGLLGAIITFAAAPLYAPHWLTTHAWGLTPLEDQQLAGLLMWAPGSAIYLAAALRIGWRALEPQRLSA